LQIDLGATLAFVFMFAPAGGVMIFAPATCIALREKKLHQRRESR
jgi:hypothetical protein